MLTRLLKLAWRDSAKANREAGKRALDAGDSAEASRLLEAAVRSAPDDPDAAFLAGIARLQLRAFDAALAHFERAIRLVPTSADAHAFAGRARLALGDTTGAKRCCDDALARDAANLAAHGLQASLDLPGPQYTELLAALHRTLKPRTYVEIGIARGDSLAMVLPTTRVVGIDPEPRLAAAPPANVQIHAMPSDEYFAHRDLRADLGGLPVDLAFIDGAHTFDQALRDFINVERHAHAASTIALHDTFPLDRLTAERERASDFWSGDVWRLVLILKKYRPELTIANVAAAPTGLCIVRGLDPASRLLADHHDAIVEEYMAVDYSVLDADKAGLLNRFPNDRERVLALVGGGARTPPAPTPA